jgi:hypothetical protein
MWIGKIRAMTLVSSGPLARLAELLVQAPADAPASESTGRGYRIRPAPSSW